MRQEKKVIISFFFAGFDQKCQVAVLIAIFS
jgi:hypothetical protein